MYICFFILGLAGGGIFLAGLINCVQVFFYNDFYDHQLRQEKVNKELQKNIKKVY